MRSLAGRKQVGYGTSNGQRGSPVLFRSYPFFHACDPRRPAILALYSDSFHGEVRIKPFLNALLARGVIADYQVVDRSMAMASPLKSYAFTHIWCQRNVSTAQFRFLKRHAHVPIIYDIDDLITSIPDFVMTMKRRNAGAHRLVPSARKGGHGRNRAARRKPARGCPFAAGRRSSCSTMDARRRAAGAARAAQAGDLDLRRSAVLSGRKSAISWPISRHCANRAGYEAHPDRPVSTRSWRRSSNGAARSTLSRISPPTAQFLRSCAGAIGHRAAAVGSAADGAAIFRRQIGHQAGRLPVGGIVPVCSSAMP